MTSFSLFLSFHFKLLKSSNVFLCFSFIRMDEKFTLEYQEVWSQCVACDDSWRSIWHWRHTLLRYLRPSSNSSRQIRESCDEQFLYSQRLILPEYFCLWCKSISINKKFQVLWFFPFVTRRENNIKSYHGIGVPWYHVASLKYFSKDVENFHSHSIENNGILPFFAKF